MRDTPRQAASTKNINTMAEAELQLVAALREGVTVLARDTRGPLAEPGAGA